MSKKFLGYARQCTNNKYLGYLCMAWGLHSLQDFYAHRGKHASRSDNVNYDYKFTSDLTDNGFPQKDSKGKNITDESKYSASAKKIKYNTAYDEKKVDNILKDVSREKYMCYREKSKDNNFRVRRALDASTEYLGKWLGASKNSNENIRKKIYNKIYK